MDPILNSGIDFSSPFSGASRAAGNGSLGGNIPGCGDSLALIERNMQEAQERYNALRQQRTPMMQHYQQPSPTPIWDEISRIQDSLSSNQMQYLEQVPEYADSFSAVAMILNREYMKLMRPIVEGTPDGKQALQHHLDVMRRLVKQAKDAADQQAMLMQDYTQHYSHLTFDQYLKLRNNNNNHEHTNSSTETHPASAPVDR